MSLHLTNYVLSFRDQTIMATSFFCSSWQDQCHEFRSMVREGKLICTRENNPVRGPDGKMHVNKCAMCQSILYVKRLINQFDILCLFVKRQIFLI